MAKVYTVNKSRKEYTCSKCGKVIPKGSSYVWGAKFYGPTVYRHTSCGLQWWELSGSEFIQTCGRIQNCWEEDYSIDCATVDSIKSDLEELHDQLQDNLDNMPEGLQEGDTGMMLQERIEMLEDVMNELDNVDDYDTTVDDKMEEAEDDYRRENLDDDDYDTIELTEEQQGDVRSLAEAYAESEIRDQIEEALSGLEY